MARRQRLFAWERPLLEAVAKGGMEAGLQAAKELMARKRLIFFFAGAGRALMDSWIDRCRSS